MCNNHSHTSFISINEFDLTFFSPLFIYSMTVICVAMGTPMPTISLYISGNLIQQEKTRHMVSVISNVTRSMDQITCYADNGYGQSSQSAKRIIIGRKMITSLIMLTYGKLIYLPHFLIRNLVTGRPNISASLITLATLGDDVTLECEIDAHPKPKLTFNRDSNSIENITNGNKYEIKITRKNNVS